MKHIFLLFFIVSVFSTQQCDSGPCCDVANGLFKEKGSKCSKPDNECHVAITTCSGFSAACSFKNTKNGEECSTGVCMNGKCVNKKIAKQITKTETKTTKTDKKDTITQTTTSTVRIDEETKELQIKITAELEKAKTLLLSVTLSDKKAKQALDNVLKALDVSLKLQATENAEQLSLASSKLQAQMKIALSQLKIAAQGADADSLDLFEEASVVLQKAEANIKEQKKDARANASGKSRNKDKEEKARIAAEKVNALINKGLPVITKAAINAADKLEVMQQERLAQLVAEKIMIEKREKARIIDEELRRVTKKAKAARVNSLRMFEKEEKNDEDAQALKQEAKNIIAADPEMKMRFFAGLTEQLLDSNYERFQARERKKLPNDEKYADDFAKEHEIVRRNEEALIDSGYFGDKYGRMNITLPEVSSESAPSLMATLTGGTGGQNWLAIALFICAGVCVVFIIFAVIKKATSGSENHKKDDDDDFDSEDDYEKF